MPHPLPFHFPKLRRLSAGLMATALLLPALLPDGAVAAADEGALPRTITVSGRGSVEVKPDIARISLAVERRNPSMRAARDAAVRVSGDFLALCKRLGIPDNKIRTSGLTIQPEYRWHNDGQQPTLTGYYVRRQLEVELTDLEKLGELMEGAVDVGVNQVSPPQLDSSQARERNREALAAAAADARTNAERIAATLGVKLGPLRSLVAGDATPPPPMPKVMAMRADAMVAESAGATYTAGEIGFEATVNATFDVVVP